MIHCCSVLTFLSLWSRGACPCPSVATPETLGSEAAGFWGRADHPAGDSISNALLPNRFKRNKQLFFSLWSNSLFSIKNVAQRVLLFWNSVDINKSKFYLWTCSLCFSSPYFSLVFFFLPPSLFLALFFFPFFFIFLFDFISYASFLSTTMCQLLSFVF